MRIQLFGTRTRATGLASVLVGLAILVGVVAPQGASAGYEYFMSNQSLSAGNAKSSPSAHSGMLRTYGYSDHTFCPAIARGYSGYTSTPWSGGNTTAGTGACGYGLQAGEQWTGNDHWRGAVTNPNQSTSDFFTFAYYDWS